MLRIFMNISVVILCFALIVQLVAGRANQKYFFHLSFVLLTNAMNCIYLSKDKNGLVILIYS